MSCWVVEKCCVVLCNLKSIGNSGFGGGLGWFLEAVCSDSWVWRRSGEVWERPYVAIPRFGGGLGGDPVRRRRFEDRNKGRAAAQAQA